MLHGMQVLKGMLLLLAIGAMVQVMMWKPEPAAPARPLAELQSGLAAMKAQVAQQKSLIEQQRSQIKALMAQVKTSGASSTPKEKQPDADENADADTEGAGQQGASGPEPAPAVPAPAPAPLPLPGPPPVPVSCTPGTFTFNTSGLYCDGLTAIPEADGSAKDCVIPGSGRLPLSPFSRHSATCNHQRKRELASLTYPR